MSNWGNVTGPDVSFYQDNNNTPQQINFNQMRTAGADFVIIRAGQNTWADPDFAYNWKAAKAAGLPRGAYWFYDSRATPISQAKLFASLIVNDLPELGAWLDLEETYGGSYQGWQNWRLCLESLRISLPRVGIYTAPFYWMERRPSTSEALSFFKSFELWIAHYNVTTPLIPGPWTSAVFWQYGTPALGIQYGCESVEIDMNYFNGDQQAFENYFNLAPSQPTGGQMPIYKKCVAADGLNIRKGPGTSYADIGDLVLGDHVIGSEEIGGWLHLTGAFRGGWDGDPVKLTTGLTVGAQAALSNDVWAKASYLVAVAPPPLDPEPPGTVFPSSVTLNYPDGTKKDYVPQ